MDVAPPPSAELAAAALREALAGAQAEADALREEVARLQHALAEAERLADADPLTPVLNRRAFMRELGRALSYAERYRAHASLIFFDLDGFKAVNDRFGHAAGDAALQAVAALLAANVRGSDVVGRLGGDEFAVILSQADAEASEAKAADLARRIAGCAVEHEGRRIALQTSYGVRVFAPGAQAAQILAEADAAMFVRKGARRKA